MNESQSESETRLPREDDLVRFDHPTKNLRCVGRVVDGMSGDEHGNLFVSVIWRSKRFTLNARRVTIVAPAPEIAPADE